MSTTRGRPATPLKVVPFNKEPDIPTPPERLSEAGKTLWGVIWTDGGTWLNAADSIIAQRVCEFADEIIQLENELEIGVHPRFYRLSNRTIIEHPAVKRKDYLKKEQAVLLGQLGFTPSARAKMALATEASNEALLNLLAGRHAAGNERGTS